MSDTIKITDSARLYADKTIADQIEHDGMPFIITALTLREPRELTLMHGEYIEGGLIADLRTCEQKGHHEWVGATSVEDTHYQEVCRYCGEWRALGAIKAGVKEPSEAEAAQLRIVMLADGTMIAEGGGSEHLQAERIHARREMPIASGRNGH